MPEPVSSPWTALGLHLDVLTGVILLAIAWTTAWQARRLPISRPHALAFAASLATVVVALNGPLHALAENFLFSAHMVQHLLLTHLFAPLLLIGMPGWMIDGLLAGGRRRRRLGALVRSVTRPLPAFTVYSVTLIVWHLPDAYELALYNHNWHVVQHLTMMGAAVLAWWPVLSASRVAPALPYGGQILYLFVSGMPMTVVAAMIASADGVLYPFYAEAPRVAALSALADQRLGGLIMWVPAALVPVFVFTAVFFRWVAAEPEDPFDIAESSSAT